MDGKIFPNDGENHPMPPFHPGCRTTTVPALDPAFAELEEGATRIAKGADGTEVVPADTSYFEWLKTQPREFVEKAIGPRRAELLLDGQISATRFSELNLDRTFQPRTLDEMKAVDDTAFLNVESAKGAKNNLTSGGESGILLQEQAERLGVKLIDGEHTLSEDAKAVNPNRGDPGYDWNCSNCARAYEMRRRGFDVEAAPRFMGANDLELRSSYVGFNEERPMEKTKTKLVAEVERRVLEWGDGARGMIYGDWTDGNGHVFSVEVSNGRVVFVEPQDPLGLAEPENHLKKMIPSTVRFGRVDNLEPYEKLIRSSIRKAGTE